MNRYDPAQQRVLVAVGGAPDTTSSLIDAAARIAARRGGELYVLLVEPQDRHVPADLERAIAEAKARTDACGGSFIRRRSDYPAVQILTEAEALAATAIVLGRSTRPWWQALLFGSPIELIRRAVRGVDVLVVDSIRGDAPAA